MFFNVKFTGTLIYTYSCLILKYLNRLRSSYYSFQKHFLVGGTFLNGDHLHMTEHSSASLLRGVGAVPSPLTSCRGYKNGRKLSLYICTDVFVSFPVLLPPSFSVIFILAHLYLSLTSGKTRKSWAPSAPFL